MSFEGHVPVIIFSLFSQERIHKNNYFVVEYIIFTKYQQYQTVMSFEGLVPVIIYFSFPITNNENTKKYQKVFQLKLPRMQQLYSFLSVVLISLLSPEHFAVFNVLGTSISII